MRWYWNLRYGHPRPVSMGDDKKAMFIHRSAENERGWNADFNPTVRGWCRQNLRRPYWIHGFWDDSTFMHDFYLPNEYTVFFYSEEDAALFKLFWL